jgi:hypothetical protein
MKIVVALVLLVIISLVFHWLSPVVDDPDSVELGQYRHHH